MLTIATLGDKKNIQKIFSKKTPINNSNKSNYNDNNLVNNKQNKNGKSSKTA